MVGRREAVSERLTHHLTGREQLHHFFIIISIAAVAVRGRVMLAALSRRVPDAFVLLAVAARGRLGQRPVGLVEFGLVEARGAVQFRVQCVVRVQHG